MMEDLGLGTKSTRHEAIQKLYARNYVHGNPPQPTNMAFAVVGALEKYADLITKPDMTSRLEEDMDNIAEGKIVEENVVKESQGMLETIFNELEGNHKEIREVLYDGLREDSSSANARAAAKTCSCGKARRAAASSDATATRTVPSYYLSPVGTIIVTDKSCETRTASATSRSSPAARSHGNWDARSVTSRSGRRRRRQSRQSR